MNVMFLIGIPSSICSRLDIKILIYFVCRKPSTAPVTKASPSPKKNKKQKRKEKSMNKPVSPIVKPPKKKKMENGQVSKY